jgi:hypothetical protein
MAGFATPAAVIPETRDAISGPSSAGRTGVPRRAGYRGRTFAVLAGTTTSLRANSVRTLPHAGQAGAARRCLPPPLGPSFNLAHESHLTPAFGRRQGAERAGRNAEPDQKTGASCRRNGRRDPMCRACSPSRPRTPAGFDISGRERGSRPPRPLPAASAAGERPADAADVRRRDFGPRPVRAASRARASRRQASEGRARFALGVGHNRHEETDAAVVRVRWLASRHHRPPGDRSRRACQAARHRAPCAGQSPAKPTPKTVISARSTTQNQAICADSVKPAEQSGTSDHTDVTCALCTPGGSA